MQRQVLASAPLRRHIPCTRIPRSPADVGSSALGSTISTPDHTHRNPCDACARALASVAAVPGFVPPHSAPDSAPGIDNMAGVFAVGATPDSCQKSSSDTTPIQLRGPTDSAAMLARWHDAALHRRWRPIASTAAELFDAMERNRCESIGALQYRGVAINLHQHQLQQSAGARRAELTGAERLLRTISEQCWMALRPESASEHDEVDAPLEPHWRALRTLRFDQIAFADAALRIIREQLTASMLESPAGDADEFEPAPAPSTDEEEQSFAINPQAREERETPDDEHDDSSDGFEMEDAGGDSRDEPVAAGNQRDELTTEQQQQYRIYSKAGDEVIGARSFCSDQELAELRKLLDIQSQRHSEIIGKLAGRLQRLLMAQQQRHWLFDLDEGTLDTARLTRVVTEPMAPLSFRRESDIPFRATTVTLLIDNSKSMLGQPIAIAACCADLLSRTLERCGVGVEVLGFTTTHLHGGPVIEDWHNNGTPPNPGRLNSLRHIVFKSAATPYRRARNHFGLFLNKHLLKQNIDGEALLWASQRLRQQPEPRKILMVISDGAPLDVTTVAANRTNILDNHLHQVIGSIEKSADIELVAIGIGHDVRNYYQRAITINDASRLGNAMLTQLAGLFS